MLKRQNFYDNNKLVTLTLPEDNFFYPTEVKKKHDLACILQNQFIDRIKPLGLVQSDKLEEFRYLCESYFDYLNLINEDADTLNYLEDEDERYF